MEEIPTVGVDSPGKAPAAEPAFRFRWGLAALVAAIGAFWLVGGGEAVPDGAEELPALPTTVPTTLAPPPNSARLVDETLQWSSANGLGDLVRIDALADLAGPAALIAGVDTGGLSVYRTDEGGAWEKVITLADEVDQQTAPAVATVIEGRVLVAVNPGALASDEPGPWVWHSEGGLVWSGGPLPNAGASALVTEIVPFGEDLLVTGFLEPRPDLAALISDLPLDVLRLVREGVAVAGVEGREVLTVRIPPGLLVYSRPLSQEEIAESLDAPPNASVAWQGPDPDALATTTAPTADVIGALPDGRLLGTRGDGLILSTDGQTWGEEIAGITPWGVSGWNGGIVGFALDGRNIAAWEPRSGEVRTVGPSELFGGGAVWTVVASGSGIAATLGGTYILPESQVIPLWTDGDDEWVVTSSMNLIVRGEDEDEASVALTGAEGSVVGDHLVVVVGDHRLEMPVAEWLSRVEHIDVAGGRGGLEVAHSPDGVSWSFEAWSDFTGTDAVAPRLFATNDFVLAVEQGPGGAIAGAWVGHPAP
jgi:hypothetical protein